MGVDTTALDAAIAALTTQVGATETVEGSATALIVGFAAQLSKAVTDALTADEAATATSIAAAQKAIADTTARFTASAGKLGDAVATVNPPPGV